MDRHLSSASPVLLRDGDTDSEILALWSAGRDTLDIARALGVPEADVVNRLPKVLAARRERQRVPA